MKSTLAQIAPKEAEPGIPERHFYLYMLAIVGVSALAICILSVGGQPQQQSRDLYHDGAATDGGRTP